MASDTATLIAVAGVLVGVLLRALIPFLKKASQAEQAGQKISFAPKYIATTLLAVIIGAFTAIQALSLITIPEATDWQELLTVFTFAASYGVAFQTTLNFLAEVKA
jgi:hypothetical protein